MPGTSVCFCACVCMYVIVTTLRYYLTLDTNSGWAHPNLERSFCASVPLDLTALIYPAQCRWETQSSLHQVETQIGSWMGLYTDICAQFITPCRGLYHIKLGKPLGGLCILCACRLTSKHKNTQSKTVMKLSSNIVMQYTKTKKILTHLLIISIWPC